tara:strand:- start:182 stop:1129 length:948 start_codon:yes stop_codon:yes gene_type:complete
MRMDKWQQYLAEAKRKKKSKKRKKPSRKSGAGLERSLNFFLDTGPQKKGGWPGGKKRPSFRRKKFNDISAPPGAPGGLEEEVDPESFDKQAELAPKFWLAGKLNPKIAKRLKKIANEFLNGLDIDAEMEDLRLTGSLANYNWSKYSDVDLHIVVDFSKIDENTKLVEDFFYGAIWRWNELHDITIYGHEIEIFVENVGHVTHSAGIYSIINKEWVIEPDPDKIDYDYITARKKADGIEAEANLIEKIVDEKPLAAVKSLDRLKDKIRRMRRAGLHSPEQEYSAENIAFKILRREETLDKINDLKYDAYDKVLSIG